MPEERKKDYSPPPVNREVVEKLKAFYRQKHTEEFSDLRKRLPRGYPVKPPANLPPS